MPSDPTVRQLQARIEQLEAAATTRDAMVSELQKSAWHLRAIIENTNLPVFLKDANLNYLLVNPIYEQLAAHSNEDIQGLTDFDVFDEPTAQLFRAQDEQVREKDELVNFEETVPLGGVDYTFLTSKFPVRDDGGNVYGYAGICTNITNLKKTEAALHESKARFRKLFEQSPMGILLYELHQDDRLVLIDSNPAADQILGTQCRPLIGKTIEKAFPALVGTEVADRYRAACRGAAPWHSDLVDDTDGATAGAFEVHAFQTTPGQMAVFIVDVTQKLRMQKEQQKIQKLESVGVLAGGIAHDFNNILTSILGSIGLASLEFEANPTAVPELLQEATQAAQTARNLTQQLLTFSRGGHPVRKVASIVDVITDSAAFVLRGRSVGCTYDFSNELLAVEIDVGQMSQVIQNILINAAQAMPSGGNVEIQCKNFVNHQGSALPLPPGEFVKTSVIDSGVGIPANVLADIFDPYFTTKSEGSGLGLAITHSIVSQHGGHIEAISSPGEGSTFHVYLPAAAEAHAEVEPERPSLEIAGNPRILFMDDESMVRTAASKLLEYMGCRVSQADEGKVAVDMYRVAFERGESFDLVLTDLTVPAGMGGREAARQILAIDPGARIVVSSGYSNDPVMAECTEYGFRGAIVKPFSPADLCHIIRASLA